MENNKEELLLKEIEDFLIRNPKITRTELQSSKRNYYDFLTKRKLMNNYSLQYEVLHMCPPTKQERKKN